MLCDYHVIDDRMESLGDVSFGYSRKASHLKLEIPSIEAFDEMINSRECIERLVEGYEMALERCDCEGYEGRITHIDYCFTGDVLDPEEDIEIMIDKFRDQLGEYRKEKGKDRFRLRGLKCGLSSLIGSSPFIAGIVAGDQVLSDMFMKMGFSNYFGTAGSLYLEGSAYLALFTGIISLVVLFDNIDIQNHIKDMEIAYSLIDYN